MAERCQVAAYVCVCAFARVCTCVRVCARVSSLWVKHPLWIFANPLYNHLLYIGQLIRIYVMWDYLSMFLFADDVA